MHHMIYELDLPSSVDQANKDKMFVRNCKTSSVQLPWCMCNVGGGTHLAMQEISQNSVCENISDVFTL